MFETFEHMDWEISCLHYLMLIHLHYWCTNSSQDLADVVFYHLLWGSPWICTIWKKVTHHTMHVKKVCLSSLLNQYNWPPLYDWHIVNSGVACLMELNLDNYFAHNKIWLFNIWYKHMYLKMRIMFFWHKFYILFLILSQSFSLVLYGGCKKLPHAWVALIYFRLLECVLESHTYSLTLHLSKIHLFVH